MNRMMAAKGIFDAFRAYTTKSVDEVKFSELNPEMFDLVVDIEMNYLR